MWLNMVNGHSLIEKYLKKQQKLFFPVFLSRVCFNKAADMPNCQTDVAHCHRLTINVMSLQFFSLNVFVFLFSLSIFEFFNCLKKYTHKKNLNDSDDISCCRNVDDARLKRREEKNCRLLNKKKNKRKNNKQQYFSCFTFFLLLKLFILLFFPLLPLDPKRKFNSVLLSIFCMISQ